MLMHDTPETSVQPQIYKQGMHSGCWLLPLSHFRAYPSTTSPSFQLSLRFCFCTPIRRPEFTNETMMTDPEKLLNRSVYRARPLQSALGADLWLSPRLAWQLQLAQKSKPRKTNTKNHRLSQIITSLEL